MIVSSECISCHEFASQFGLSFVLYAVIAVGHGLSPLTSRNGNELSDDNILWSRLITSGPSERRQHERRPLRSKRLQREFIPSRLEMWLRN